MATCGTPAYISLGVDISPLTETLNFLRKKRANKLVRLIKNFNLDNLYNKAWCHVEWKVFSIPNYTAAVVCKTHILNNRAVRGMETWLAYIKQASFLNVPLDSFQNNFIEQPAFCVQEINQM
jgi:hypothetical protein